jgi:hypothetical protein
MSGFARRRPITTSSDADIIESRIKPFLDHLESSSERIREILETPRVLPTVKQDYLKTLQYEISSEKEILELNVKEQRELIEIDTDSDLGKIYKYAMDQYNTFNDTWHDAYDSLSHILPQPLIKDKKPPRHKNSDIEDGNTLIRSFKSIKLANWETFELIEMLIEIKEYMERMKKTPKYNVEQTIIDTDTDTDKIYDILGNLDMYSSRILDKIKSKMVSKIQQCDKTTFTGIEKCIDETKETMAILDKITQPEVKSVVTDYFENLSLQIDKKKVKMNQILKDFMDKTETTGYESLDNENKNFLYYYLDYFSNLTETYSGKKIFNMNQVYRIVILFTMIHNFLIESKTSPEHMQTIFTELTTIPPGNTVGSYITSLEQYYTKINPASASELMPPSASELMPPSASELMPAQHSEENPEFVYGIISRNGEIRPDNIFYASTMLNNLSAFRKEKGLPKLGIGVLSKTYFFTLKWASQTGEQNSEEQAIRILSLHTQIEMLDKDMNYELFDNNLSEYGNKSLENKNDYTLERYLEHLKDIYKQTLAKLPNRGGKSKKRNQKKTKKRRGQKKSKKQQRK